MGMDWSEEVPEEVTAVIRHNHGKDSNTTYTALRQEASPVTSLSTIRKLARKYSKKYHVPIRVSAKAVEEDVPDGEAMYRYHYGRTGQVIGVIYLHPLLQYYPEAYVEGVILHEVDHMEVEKRWSQIL